MMLADSFKQRFQALTSRWEDCQVQPGADQFIEFTLALSSFTEQCLQHKLPGLSRMSEELQNDALKLYDDLGNFPLGSAVLAELAQRVKVILSSVESGNYLKGPERRTQVPSGDYGATQAAPRIICMIVDEAHPWKEGLSEQLAFFGFHVQRFGWNDVVPEVNSPQVILFIPSNGYRPEELFVIKRIRAAHPASQIFCLGVAELLDSIVTLLRAGVDVTVPAVEETSTVLAHLLDLIEAQDQEPYRVLVVEDSPTAVATIKRTLNQHGIDNHAIGDPAQLLEAVWRYRPDLVLMDMHMPHCTGVEATRVLRQLPACQSLPVVYLSSETDMGMQIAALRLGGDQFIGKPFNPVLMATIVKTKIDRYRAMQRSSLHDGLTGLLNHTASKTRLNQVLHTLDKKHANLCVAMIDIDHFKSINDMHGHPVGDQVIRNLAWLLKGRLRASDIIGRYGGEEFIVVLRDLGMIEARNILERIREDFATLPHAHANGSLHASFSAGLASFPDFLNDSELIDAADNALLSAKRNGRNRIELAGAFPHSTTEPRALGSTKV